jgi:predicted O-methyltransferase YrrM
MKDTQITPPAKYHSIRQASEKMNFSMPSDLQTGSLLRTLIASKPAGRFLELGTGTGLSLAWIVEAMDENSSVISIDNSEEYISIARNHFQDDPRVEIVCADGEEWINTHRIEKFDLIFADAWPGKYSALDETLDLLPVGGTYLIDDMLAQPNWPEGHDKKAEALIAYLETRQDLRLTKMNWSTGIIIMCKIA